MQPQGMDPRQRQLPQRNAQLMAMMRMLMAGGGNQPQVADDAARQRAAGGQNLAAMFRDQQGRNGVRSAPPGMVPRQWPNPTMQQTNVLPGDAWRAPAPGMAAYLAQRMGMPQAY